MQRDDALLEAFYAASPGDISLDDISAYDVSATAISATFKQGGSITIENANTSGVNFRFADGSTYAYNSSENQWEAKQQ